MQRGEFGIINLERGDYEQSETIIQQLLAEAGAGIPGREWVAVDGRGAEAAADWEI
jgi:hypothetical protein